MVRSLVTILYSANLHMTNLRTDEIVFFRNWWKLILTKIKQFTVSCIIFSDCLGYGLYRCDTIFSDCLGYGLYRCDTIFSDCLGYGLYRCDTLYFQTAWVTACTDVTTCAVYRTPWNVTGWITVETTRMRTNLTVPQVNNHGNQTNLTVPQVNNHGNQTNLTVPQVSNHSNQTDCTSGK